MSDRLYSTQSVLRVLNRIRLMLLALNGSEPTLPDLVLVLKRYEELPDAGDETDRIADAIADMIPAPEF